MSGPALYSYTRRPPGLRCSPHAWRTPAAGDTALECERCGRWLPYADIPRWQLRSIARAKPPAWIEAFRAAWRTWRRAS